MKMEILYIGDQPGEDWVADIKTRLKSDVRMIVTSEEEAPLSLAFYQFSLILIDSGSVDDVPALIYALKEVRPEAQIIVLTNSPTWNRALQAYQAGALDYLSKLLNKEQLSAAINRLIPLVTTAFPLALLHR